MNGFILPRWAIHIYTGYTRNNIIGMDWCQELCVSAFKSFAEQKIATKITYAHYREGAVRQHPVCLWLNLPLLLLLPLFFRKVKHDWNLSVTKLRCIRAKYAMILLTRKKHLQVFWRLEGFFCCLFVWLWFFLLLFFCYFVVFFFVWFLLFVKFLKQRKYPSNYLVYLEAFDFSIYGGVTGFSLKKNK